MTIEQYRAMFYSALDACGVDNPLEGPEGAKRHRYTPHSCRHTFATLMKRVDGADKDKLELIGHTSNEMRTALSGRISEGSPQNNRRL